MFLNTLPVPKLQRRRRRIARPSGGEAWIQPNITAHSWPMAFWKHLNVTSGTAANHISMNSSSLHSTLPQYFMQVFSQKCFELLLCLFLWRGDNEQRIFLKKIKNLVLNPKQITSRKGLDTKLMLQSRVTNKLLFSGRNNKINTFLSLKIQME